MDGGSCRLSGRGSRDHPAQTEAMRTDRTIELFEAAPGLERGIYVFEAIYRASWKQQEPLPAFNAARMREAGAQGTLRLGVLWLAEGPAAAQFGIVVEGRATVLKLAHDETLQPLSAATVLTAMMLRHLLDEGGSQIWILAGAATPIRPFGRAARAARWAAAHEPVAAWGRCGGRPESGQALWGCGAGAWLAG